MHCCSLGRRSESNKSLNRTGQMSGSNLLKLPVKVGTKSFDAIVDCSENVEREQDEEQDGADAEASTAVGEGPLRTVGELREFITREGGYAPGSTLKIIFRGKYIGNDPNEPLSKYKFKKTDKLMVVGGNAPSFNDDAGMKAIIEYEKHHVEHLRKLLETNTNDLAELERNFLEGKLLAEMVARMDKRLKLYTENSLRHLENIDALPIYSEQTSDEQRLRNREKRKHLVKEVQELMSRNDKLGIELEQYVNQVSIEKREEPMLRPDRADGEDDKSN